METRILTLFDDETFEPKQESKEKPQKEKASNAVKEPDLFLLFEEDKEQEMAAEESSVIDATTVIVPQDIVEKKPEITEDKIEVAPSENDTHQALNLQILTELVQTDYAALMQKNYSFDLGNASVIKKETKKAIAVIEETASEVGTESEEVFEEIPPLPEWKLEKNYYSIGEVAQMFEVNTSHIRFWTNEFKMKTRTTRKGDRLYSPKDIAELRLIHHLVKVKKHTIKGAREKLKTEKSGVNNKLDLKESLVQLRDTLLKIREQL